MVDVMLQNMVGESKLIFCNRCRNETNHLCQAAHSRLRTYGVEWEETWYGLWVCAGCEEALLETRYEDSGCGGEPDLAFFPKRYMHGTVVKRLTGLPADLQKVYAETIEAFNSGLHVLCAAGLRSLLEGICDDKGMQGNKLDQKIKGLTSILPQNLVTSIDSLRFIGNNAVHDLKAPTAEALRLGIEVLEDLMNFLYELEHKASGLDRYRKTGSTLMRGPIWQPQK
jgi:hypothetical protein